ncbi:MAG: hypothetical protein KTR30_05480, partial [Saprospiraceae bacterium]|nr:hypothetical protein [Saprospiraceae bacterium]
MKRKAISRFTTLLCLSIIGLFSQLPKAFSQDQNLQLRYFGTAGWEITDGTTTILIDPYLSRLKLGTGPSVSQEDARKTYSRSDYFESDTVLID